MEVRVPWYRKLVYHARGVHEPAVMELNEKSMENMRRWKEVGVEMKKAIGGDLPAGTTFANLVKMLPPAKQDKVTELMNDTIRTSLAQMSRVPEGGWKRGQASSGIMVLDTLVRNLGELKGKKALLEVLAEAKGEHNLLEASGFKLPNRHRAYEAYERLMKSVD